MLEVVLQQIDDEERLVRDEELTQTDAVFRPSEILVIAQQQPPCTLDDFTCLAVVPEPIGFIRADPVDHLTTVLGDDVEQVINDFGTRALSAHLLLESDAHVHGHCLDALTHFFPSSSKNGRISSRLRPHPIHSTRLVRGSMTTVA